MGSMMNGYYYDVAKDGSNQYSVKVNDYAVVTGATYNSALGIYKGLTEEFAEKRSFESVQLIKEYDTKGNYSDETVRDNEKLIEKTKKQWTRTLSEGMRFADDSKKYFVIGKPEQVITVFGTYMVGQTGAVIKTNKGYFVECVDGDIIYSKNLADVKRFLPEGIEAKQYAESIGITTGKVYQVLIHPVLSDTDCTYVATENLGEFKYLRIEKENK